MINITRSNEKQATVPTFNKSNVSGNPVSRRVSTTRNFAEKPTCSFSNSATCNNACPTDNTTKVAICDTHNKTLSTLNSNSITNINSCNTNSTCNGFNNSNNSASNNSNNVIQTNNTARTIMLY